jgi:AcrR family transcriptional regulator
MPKMTEPNPETTAQRLITAAMAEFNQDGFAATDSNKIARRAGFAPQTFYRWFKDKTAIFLAVYKAWSDAEIALLSDVTSSVGWASAHQSHQSHQAAEQMVDTLISHHRTYRIFRRSLRTLAVENSDVRAARAENRTQQLAALQTRLGLNDGNKAQAFVLMLQIERLADALAEDEFADLGVDDAEVRLQMIGLIDAQLKRA